MIDAYDVHTVVPAVGACGRSTKQPTPSPDPPTTSPDPPTTSPDPPPSGMSDIHS